MRIAPALAGLTLVLTGCTASVTTHIQVSESAGAATSYQVSLQGELADAVRQDPVTDQGIFDILARHGDGLPSREDSGDVITYSVPADAGSFVPDLTGVSSLVVSSSEGETTATLSILPPEALITAVRGAAQEEPDGDALELTFLKSVFLEYIVVMPGEIAAVSGSLPYSYSGSTARIRVPLDSVQAAEITVRSQASSVPPALVLGAAILLGGLAYGGYTLVSHRRRVSK